MKKEKSKKYSFGAKLTMDCNIDFKKNRAGVYMVIFGSGHFYIGGTKNFRDRIGTHKQNFKQGVYYNKAMKAAAENQTIVKMELLEMIEDYSSILKREDFHIRKNKDNPLLLNRSKTSYSNKGIKWTVEERKAISKGTIGLKRSDETRKKMSLAKRGKLSHTAKITEEDVRVIRKMHLAGQKQISISKELNISDSIVSSVIRRISWKYVV